MRRRVIAGNWKMYKTLADTRAFFSSFLPLVAGAKHCDMVVAPPFTAISTALEAVKGSRIAIAGQNVSWSREGAFTGEVSAPMLAEAGCRYGIIDHSERHQLFRDTDDNVAKQTLMALASGLTPIVCLGETQEDRDTGLTEEVLSRQFSGGPCALTPEEFSRILMAYEPVWAIGTGRTATPEIAADAHRFLRRCAGEKFSIRHASALRILYGGSVKPDNIQGLMAQEELDGALVGGASLDPKSFAALVNFAYRSRTARSIFLDFLIEGRHGYKNICQVGSRPADWRGDCCHRLPVRWLAAQRLFHSKLSGVDHRGAAPERQGRGPRRRLRRRRQSDGLRSAWRGQRSVESHDLVRRDVHAVRDGHGAAHGQGRWARQLDPRKGCETRTKTGVGNTCHHTGNNASDQTGDGAIGAAVQHATCFPASGRFAASSRATEKTIAGSKLHFRTDDLTLCIVGFTMGVIAVVAELADALA